MNNPLVSLAVLCLMLSAGIAEALDLPSAPDSFSLRGFGTLGVVHNSTDKAEFVRDKTQPKGPRGGGFMWETDSRLGLQMNWKPRENIEVMIQGLTSYRYDGSYRPRITWALLKYAVTPEVEVRVGRLGFDIYLNAESRNVGYSYLWVRPPVEYYGSVNYESMDGLDVTVSKTIGDGILRAKLLAGQLDDHIALGNGMEYDAQGMLYGAQLKYQTPNWLFSGSIGALDVQIETPLLRQLRDALLSTGVPQAASVARDLSLSRNNVYYFTLSAAYDQGPLQSALGVTRVSVDSASYPGNYSGFWSLGYRVGKWTPFAVVARAKSDPNKVDTGLPNIPMLAPINAGVQLASTLNQVDQDTLTVGTRFDVARNLDLKVQLDWIHSRVNPSLLWLEADPDWNGRATLLSVSLDFVF